MAGFTEQHRFSYVKHITDELMAGTIIRCNKVASVSFRYVKFHKLGVGAESPDEQDDQ